MEILNPCIFNNIEWFLIIFWTLKNLDFSKALNPLKTISDDSIWHPKGHPSILRKSQNLDFFRFFENLIFEKNVGIMQKVVSMNFVVKIKVVEEVKLYRNSWISAQSGLWESSYEKNLSFFLKILIFSYLTIFEKIFLMKKYSVLIKYASFELLDHHHELNQKKLILKDFFMFKINSPMLKLWSIPLSFLYILLILYFCWKWHYFLKIKKIFKKKMIITLT